MRRRRLPRAQAAVDGRQRAAPGTQGSPRDRAHRTRIREAEAPALSHPDRPGPYVQERGGRRDRGSPLSTPGMERVEKPWGYELIFAHTDSYVGKIIHIDAGHRLSRQYHVAKDETLLVESGELD